MRLEERRSDNRLDETLAKIWLAFYTDLSAINIIQVPRWIQTTKGREIKLYGFCDASNIGYAAVIYVRCAIDNSVWCNILTAKTKIASVKTVDTPRLELCGAWLLSKLMKRKRVQ